MTIDVRKSVLITGCTNGSIGEALAREFQRRGCWVFASSRRTETMSSLEEQGIETIRLDITKLESIRAAKDIIFERTGGSLDILVNNAGIAYAAAASDMSMDQVRELFDVNLFGHMAMVKEFLPLLLASDDARVIQIASLAGLMPVPFNSAYNASKAALLLSFGDTLRVELAPFGIKVINVAAGNVQSNIMRGSPRSLPPDSLYYPINEESVRDRIDRFQDGAVPAGTFARTVVSATLRKRPLAWVYTANNAWTVWIVSTFLGHRGFMGILSPKCVQIC